MICSCCSNVLQRYNNYKLIIRDSILNFLKPLLLIKFCASFFNSQKWYATEQVVYCAYRVFKVQIFMMCIAKMIYVVNKCVDIGEKS